MKKIILVLLFLVLINVFSYSQINKVNASEVVLEINAPSAVLIEPISKKVLYEKNKDKKLYPASMTKMMALSLVLEEINNNKITWNDEVITSSYAASMGGTQIYLEENEKMTVKDLFKAVAINSANDAVVALMEHLYGSKDGFLHKMNAKAKELNMLNTNFNNATGFDDENHYSTSFDMALLGSYLVSFGKDILQFTSLKEGYVRENSSSPFWLVNTNKLLNHYEGMDGLKTGYTTKAGYNLTATAYRNGVRLISVVMNEDSIKNRSKDTITLLNHGFSLLKCERLFNKGDIIKEIVLDDIKNTCSPIKVNEDIDIYLFKNESIDDIKVELQLFDKLKLPLKQDDEIGELIITTKNDLIYKYKVYIGQDIKKTTFLDILFSFFKMMFA